MDPTKPQPQRFEVYTMLPDGKGFTIKDCKFVFKLDRYGGWRDEYGHYYNSHGEPDFQPQDAELTPSQGSIYSDDAGDDYGQFQPDYDDVDDQHEQHHVNWEIRNMEKISKNIQTLSSYPAAKPLRVFFSNMPFKAPPKSVYEAYSKKVSGIINIIFDLQNNRRNGQGYFIMEDVKKAEALIKLEGQQVIQRSVHFEVQKISELMIDPIKQSDMNPFWGLHNTNSTKNDPKKQQKKQDNVPKFKAALAQVTSEVKKVQQTKKNEKKQTVQVKEQKKIEKPKQQAVKKQVEVKKQPEPQFKRYKLNFQIFDTKTKFFNWLQENGATKDVDVKNIVKQETGGNTVITMEVKKSALDKLDGKKYNGKQAKFTLV